MWCSQLSCRSVQRGRKEAGPFCGVWVSYPEFCPVFIGTESPWSWGKGEEQSLPWLSILGQAPQGTLELLLLWAARRAGGGETAFVLLCYLGCAAGLEGARPQTEDAALPDGRAARGGSKQDAASASAGVPFSSSLAWGEPVRGVRDVKD